MSIAFTDERPVVKCQESCTFFIPFLKTHFWGRLRKVETTCFKMTDWILLSFRLNMTEERAAYENEQA